MKITKSQLKQIIKEELSNILTERVYPTHGLDRGGDAYARTKEYLDWRLRPTEEEIADGYAPGEFVGIEANNVSMGRWKPAGDGKLGPYDFIVRIRVEGES